MNIYRFVDSKDIREHLEKINYEFNTQEAAYIVWHCRTASLTEKQSMNFCQEMYKENPVN